MGKIFVLILNHLAEEHTRVECVRSPLPEIGDKRKVVIKSLICKLAGF
jgi:hypothetical protein